MNRNADRPKSTNLLIFAHIYLPEELMI